MSIIKIITSLVFTSFLFCNVNGQSKSMDNCSTNFKGYISEIQQYPINVKEDTKLDVVFYAGFAYRFALCSAYKDIKLNLILKDEMGNLQYSNSISYGFSHDFKFETVFHGTITIKPENVDNNQAELIIGYKRI